MSMPRADRVPPRPTQQIARGRGEQLTSFFEGLDPRVPCKHDKRGSFVIGYNICTGPAYSNACLASMTKFLRIPENFPDCLRL